jgi:hypothetical protein
MVSRGPIPSAIAFSGYRSSAIAGVTGSTTFLDRSFTTLHTIWTELQSYFGMCRNENPRGAKNKGACATFEI